MEKDRIKWNKKHLESQESDKPSDIVMDFCGMAKNKRALDIACGTGRNTIFLAQQGFTVDAVDISEVGLKKLTGKNLLIRPVCADLDHFDIAPQHYDLIINIRYLNRRLFPYIKEGLVSGGVLIFESFMDNPSDNPSKDKNVSNKDHQPSCRDYLFRENELLHGFLSLTVKYYREFEIQHGGSHQWMASLVALKGRCS
jgi:tellurite methyltransferase